MSAPEAESEAQATRSVQIGDVASFLQEIERLDGKGLVGLGAGRVLRWYRGQSDSTHRLLPEILRESFLNAANGRNRGDPEGLRPLLLERALLRDLRLSGAHFLRGADELEIYFTARHYRLPSRILDWSLSPLVALFFAAVADQQRDGAVYALDVADVLRSPVTERDPELQVAIRRCFPQADHTLHRDDDASLLALGESRTGPVIAVLPDSRPGRLLAQQSAFTFHSPGAATIEELAAQYQAQSRSNNSFVRFKILGAQKPSIVAMLRKLGIDWSTLFPDLDHMVTEIRARTGLG